jgi:Ni/Co efflux regulator RcnB
MKHALTAAISLTLIISSPIMAANHQDKDDHLRPTHRQYDNRHSKAHLSRGDIVPSENRRGAYRVTNWRYRNLQAPPRGSHWVRNGHDQLVLINRRGYITRIAEQRRHPDTYRWRRGETLSDYYRHDDYVLTNWQAEHLDRPERGYHWVRVNNQYLLVAIASGIIFSLISQDGQ